MLILRVPFVLSHMLHVPTVDDPIHDLIEPRLFGRLPETEHSRLVIEHQLDLLHLLLLQVRRGPPPERKALHRSRPEQRSAVILTSSIAEVFRHQALWHNVITPSR